MTFTPTQEALCDTWTTGDVYRSPSTWAFKIYTSSQTVSTYIWRIEIKWSGTATLKTIALNSKPIWADYYGYPSPTDLTFPYTYHGDLLIPPVTGVGNPLQLTFSSDDFQISHVKVYFENDCYVQHFGNSG
jgi:hypothetical protein